MEIGISLPHFSMHERITHHLKGLAEEPYREFSQRLIPDGKPLVGVRMAPLRALAKEIAREDWRNCVTNPTVDQYHEETLLRALVLVYAKIPETERIAHIKKFLPKIDNWAICDSFCASLTTCKNYKELYLPLIETYLQDSHPYSVRFAVVMLLNYFMSPEYIHTSFTLLEQVSLPNYYVNMAVAWATATAFTTNPILTKAWLETHPLSNETMLMGIQKVRDSRQVSLEDKEWVATLREHIKAKKMALERKPDQGTFVENSVN